MYMNDDDEEEFTRIAMQMSLLEEYENQHALWTKATTRCPFADLAFWGLEAQRVDDDHAPDDPIARLLETRSQHIFFQGHHPRRMVRKVLNSDLQAAYGAKKDEMAQRLGLANVNERFLFHGTSSSNAKAIAVSNFCMSKVRSTKFGKGFYFSQDAKYSLGHCARYEAEGVLLLCRVLAGKVCHLGARATRQLANVDSNITDMEYTETVVFHPDQVLPVYSVSFR